MTHESHLKEWLFTLEHLKANAEQLSNRFPGLFFVFYRDRSDKSERDRERGHTDAPPQDADVVTLLPNTADRELLGYLRSVNRDCAAYFYGDKQGYEEFVPFLLQVITLLERADRHGILSDVLPRYFSAISWPELLIEWMERQEPAMLLDVRRYLRSEDGALLFSGIDTLFDHWNGTYYTEGVPAFAASFHGLQLLQAKAMNARQRGDGKADSPTVTHTKPANATKAEDEAPALSQRKYLFLQTMLIMNAATADTRQTTEAIVIQAEGKAADPVQFKRDVAELKSDGFIDTKIGPGGGCWLTTKGVNLANILQARISAQSVRTN